MEKFKKTLQNFWFYYKIPVLIGLAVVLVLLYFGLQNRNTLQPDYHIGVVRALQHTDEELAALSHTFAAAAADVNGDGETIVRIHTYYVDLADDSPNAGVNNSETVAALDADLVGGVSGIFLLEDVATFRRITNDLVGEPVSQMNGLFMTIRKDADPAYTALADKLS